MTDNLGFGIGALQILQEEPECCLLLRSTGVFITAFLVHATYIANTDGVLVVVFDMGTGHALGTTSLDGAILKDDPVIATAEPAFGLMPVVEVFDSDALTGSCASAVDDYPLDIFHWIH